MYVFGKLNDPLYFFFIILAIYVRKYIYINILYILNLLTVNLTLLLNICMYVWRKSLDTSQRHKSTYKQFNRFVLKYLYILNFIFLLIYFRNFFILFFNVYMYYVRMYNKNTTLKKYA